MFQALYELLSTQLCFNIDASNNSDRGRDVSAAFPDQTGPYYTAGRFKAHVAPHSPHASRARRVSLTSSASPETYESIGPWLWFSPLQLRPRQSQTEALMAIWPGRVWALTILPTVLVLAWVAVPVPTFDPDKNEPPDNEAGPLAPDVNFLFFLIWFFGCYVAIGLLWVTSLFNLYRLNWWPSARFAGRLSYLGFWLGALLIAGLCHRFDAFGARGRHDAADSVDFERKSLYISIAWATMSLPALLCFAKLRRDRRAAPRPLTDTQKTFLERQLAIRLPRSYIRFLWFILCISVALFVLPAGQAFAAVYMKTLPHTSTESLAYVWIWVIAVQLLSSICTWIIESKVRSSPLRFVFKLYTNLCYHVFLRNLFARLRSPDQFLIIQLFSSLYVVVIWPVLMSQIAYRLFRLFGSSASRETFLETMAESLFVRQLSENATMCAFLAWLTVLHFGANKDVFPFVNLVPSDSEFSYTLTMSASAIVWASEVVSSWIARRLCYWLYGVTVSDLNNLFAQIPELLPASVLTVLHVEMDILLFLVRLQFK